MKKISIDDMQEESSYLFLSQMEGPLKHPQRRCKDNQKDLQAKSQEQSLYDAKLHKHLSNISKTSKSPVILFYGSSREHLMIDAEDLSNNAVVEVGA
ncbi:unnamed protein product [Thlaspi arvense]|uniref:Uncharacterized protein n=1 Tax=Thlaspi arvense TaxID=13288 RepID=A0AAU9T8Z4_THLAR|nr:unnamed protein product [Thlaspi arvense]